MNAIVGNPHADAEILRLLSLIATNDREVREITDSWPATMTVEAATRSARLAQERQELRQRLGSLRPNSGAGWRAKAEAALIALDLHDAAPLPGSREHLAWSLCRDLLEDAA